MDGTEWVIQGVLLAAASRWALFWWSLALAGTLALGAMILLIVERYRKRAANPDVNAGDQLTHFRELYNKGTISKEEFEKILETAWINYQAYLYRQSLAANFDLLKRSAV